eukprot:3042587-Ditylum_brightwellii.AAC.1
MKACYSIVERITKDVHDFIHQLHAILSLVMHEFPLVVLEHAVTGQTAMVKHMRRFCINISRALTAAHTAVRFGQNVSTGGVLEFIFRADPKRSLGTVLKNGGADSVVQAFFAVVRSCVFLRRPPHKFECVRRAGVGEGHEPCNAWTQAWIAFWRSDVPLLLLLAIGVDVEDAPNSESEYPIMIPAIINATICGGPIKHLILEGAFCAFSSPFNGRNSFRSSELMDRGEDRKLIFSHK